MSNKDSGKETVQVPSVRKQLAFCLGFTCFLCACVGSSNWSTKWSSSHSAETSYTEDSKLAVSLQDHLLLLHGCDAEGFGCCLVIQLITGFSLDAEIKEGLNKRQLIEE